MGDWVRSYLSDLYARAVALFKMKEEMLKVEVAKGRDVSVPVVEVTRSERGGYVGEGRGGGVVR